MPSLRRRMIRASARGSFFSALRVSSVAGILSLGA
jgi:hypothetical protein